MYIQIWENKQDKMVDIVGKAGDFLQNDGQNKFFVQTGVLLTLCDSKPGGDDDIILFTTFLKNAKRGELYYDAADTDPDLPCRSDDIGDIMAACTAGGVTGVYFGGRDCRTGRQRGDHRGAAAPPVVPLESLPLQDMCMGTKRKGL